MAPKKIAKQTDDRPPKPYPTFPLFPHRKGYWARKVDQRHKSFGKWQWPNQAAYEQSWRDALNAYNKYLEDVAHGRDVAVTPGRLTVREVANAFLARQESRVPKEISAGTFTEDKRILGEFLAAIGRDTTIEQLEASPGDLAAWRDTVAAAYGYYRFNKTMGRVSSMFLWAEHPLQGVLGRPFRLRPLLVPMTERTKRQEKRDREGERGKKRWLPHELAALLTFARNPLRAMLGLAYFGAFGNTDCAELPTGGVNFKPDPALGVPEGWALIDWLRPKTLIERAAVLPPQVAADLRASLAMRPAPASAAFKDLVFLTRSLGDHGGAPWLREIVHRDAGGHIERTVAIDSIAQEFRKLRDRLAHCSDHGWFAGDCQPRGRGRRSDRLGVARADRRPKPPERCPVCDAALKPMRKLGFYSFRHTAITYAAGAVGVVALDLFEGRVTRGSRKDYVEEAEVHYLKLIAERLIAKLESANVPLASMCSMNSTRSIRTDTPVPPAAAAVAAAKQTKLIDRRRQGPSSRRRQPAA